MTTIFIRNAEENDAEAIQRLVHELAEYEKAPEDVKTTADDIKRYGFGKERIFDAMVAIVEGEIRGFALTYWKYSTWRGKALYLEDFYVQPKFRKKKIGEALFRSVVKKAQQEGAQRLEWLVLDWNDIGINFYKKMGARLDETWVSGMLFPEDFKGLIS